jgi:hypothetical protein
LARQLENNRRLAEDGTFLTKWQFGESAIDIASLASEKTLSACRKRTPHKCGAPQYLVISVAPNVT